MAHKKVLTTQILAIHGVANSNEDVSFAKQGFSDSLRLTIAVNAHLLVKQIAFAEEKGYGVKPH